MDPQILAQPGIPAEATPANPPPPAVARLSVVVVDYRQAAETTRLVRQLRQSLAARDGLAEIVLLENAARPGSRLGRLRKHKGVAVRRSRRNHGFARAVNRGCALGQGGWLLLLNPDITLPDEFLDRVVEMTDRLDAEPRVGIVGLGLQNPDGSPQRSTGPFPTATGTLLRLLLPRSSRKYHLRPPAAGPVDWVTGCCLLVRRDCWRELGGFDPAFFLYYEDVDLCRRAHQAGWQVRYEPAVTVTHHHPLHGRDVPAHLRLITRHALLTYAGRHWPGWRTRLLAGLVRAEGWARMLWAGLRGRRREAAIFGELAALAGDLAAGQIDAAEQRLDRVVHDHEEHLGG